MVLPKCPKCRSMLWEKMNEEVRGSGPWLGQDSLNFTYTVVEALAVSREMEPSALLSLVTNQRTSSFMIQLTPYLRWEDLFVALLLRMPPGAFDQSEVEMRNNILVYTGPRLQKGMEVTGPIELVLHASSSVRGTDFTGKLVDVHPDGKAYNIQEGILRARYRKGWARKCGWKRIRCTRSDLLCTPPVTTSSSATRYAWRCRAAIFPASTET